MMDDLRILEKRLNVQFRDYSLLARALAHRSYVNERESGGLENNERLEFLGDAVLDFVVGAYLYHRFPEMKEGNLTELRAALVKTTTLADLARQLNLGAFLRLGHGEAESGGRERAPTLAGAFEAVIGAVYLDRGLPVVKPLIEQLIGPVLEQILAQSLQKDAKSEFQVWAQGELGITPQYQTVGSEGPDHAKCFVVEVLVGKTLWGVGRGSSKQNAAKMAASEAMNRVGAYEAKVLADRLRGKG